MSTPQSLESLALEQAERAHATRKLAGRRKWRSLDISLEHEVGGTRRGVDESGKAWETVFKNPYGYALGTTGVDGDHGDVFLNNGPLNEDGPVYVVHQVNAQGHYDEDKAMLGFPNKKAARSAYLAHYDSPRYLGAMSTHAAADFEAFCKNPESKGKSIHPNPKRLTLLERRKGFRTQAAEQDLKAWHQGRRDMAATQRSSDVTDGEGERRDKLYKDFHHWVNMSPSELRKYASSDAGQKSGLSRSDAAKQGIASGRDRPRQIIALLGKGKPSWDADDYRIAGRVVSFCSRMSGASGGNYDDKGNLTRRAMSLLIWGHDPRKGGKVERSVDQDELMTVVFEVERAVTLEPDGERRLIRVTPNFEGIALDDELLVKETLREAWPYFESNGNIDLEHLTRKGGSLKSRLKQLRELGFPLDEASAQKYGRVFYEVGKPVTGSFDFDDCSFLAEIYQGADDVVPIANWFWKTLTEVKPAWEWKPSVAGRVKKVEILVDMPDEQLGIPGQRRIQKWSVFVWDNTAMTRTPVNHRVPAVTVVSGSSRERGMTMTEDTETVAEILRAALLKTSQDTLEALHSRGLLESEAQYALLSDVSRSLGALELGEHGELEVERGMDFGSVSGDSSDLSGGSVFVGQSLSQYRIDAMALELLDHTQRGITPFGPGYTPQDGLDLESEVADFLMQERALEADDALNVAAAFIASVLATAV